jgi:hypothetical protein
VRRFVSAHHEAQLILYLKLSKIDYGILINLHTRLLRQLLKKLTIAETPTLRGSVISVPSVVQSSCATGD